MKNSIIKNITYLTLLIITFKTCYANTLLNHTTSKITNLIIISIFVLCYTLIILEEQINIKKSTISILSASIIWIILSLSIQNENNTEIINYKIQETLQKYCELFLFLFITITYINLIKNIGIIDNIKNIFISKNTSYKKIYWTTGFLAFFISPIADNLTTALLACSIIKSMEIEDKNFINLTSINIVIASNAGGVFSPFGDITTLMIWQNNLINTKSFLYMFIPSLINFIIPAIIISTKIEKKTITINKKITKDNKSLKIAITMLFISTILITILIQTHLKMPSIIGMLLGFSLLNIFEKINNSFNKEKISIHKEIENIDWDTLLFFIGIMLCVNALSIIGLLGEISNFIYKDLIKNLNIEYTYIIANSIIGILSSIIDNIPITFAILEMNINMNEGQWLLITLTTGTGGSILSIGSSAGVAMMGFLKGKYTFLSHLKWSLVIILGYIASIFAHIIINKNLLLI